MIGVRLKHADINGGVDYCSSDESFALEVTTVTSRTKKSTRAALSKHRMSVPHPALQSCWILYVPDNQPRVNKSMRLVRSAIVELESAGETDFDQTVCAYGTPDGDERPQRYQKLLEAGVERAVSMTCEEREGHLHRLHIFPGSGGSPQTSNSSLARLVEELRTRPDNAEKLRVSGCEQRHLFVWLDDDTAYEIAFPLSRELPPSWKAEGWGLPTEDPYFDIAITHLWVVHARTGLGWRWTGDEWRCLRGCHLTPC